MTTQRTKTASPYVAEARAPAVPDWTAIDHQPTSLRSLVADRLRTAITEGILPPGERVVERALCEQLNVSRPSLREAVRQLEAEGLIEAVPYRGPVVRTLTPEEAGELFDLCELVEGLCARYFAERAEPGDVDRLEQALNEHEKALLIGNPVDVRHAKAAYYDAFVAGAKSEVVRSTVKRLNARLSQVWSSSQRHPDRITRGITEMRRIVAALRKRDADEAFRRAGTYVRSAKAYVLGVMREESAEAQAAPSRPAATRRRRAVPAAK